MAASKLMTLPGVALKLKVMPWKVQRLYEMRLLPEPERLGNARVFTEADLPAIREALVRHGLLKAPEKAAAGK